MTGRVSIVSAALLVVVVSFAACSDSASNPDHGRSTESSPFEVVDPPAGYELAEVRLGTTEPILYSESLPTQEPYTLLSEDGSLDGEVVGVSYFVLWDSNPTNTRSGLRPDEDREDYAAGDGWSDLEVHGAQMSIRVSSSAERSAEELLALAGEVSAPVPGDGNQRQPAPQIPDGLDGFEEVGRVESPVLVALQAPAAPDAYRSTDPVGSHAQRWVSDDGPDVAVRTLPGVSADLEALGEHPWMSPRLEGETTVAGRPARSLRYCIVDTYAGEQCSTALVTTSADGDLVVVSSEDDVDAAVLAGFAAGVDTVDVDRWDELARDAWGWPEPRPDLGRSEVARGTFGDVAWLAQSGGDAGGQLWQELDIDRCLKLSTLVRACGLGSSGGFGAAESVVSWEVGDLAVDGDDQRPIDDVGYVAVSGLPGAAAVHIEGAAFDDGDDVRPAFDVTVDLAPGAEASGGIAVVPYRIGSEPWGPQDDPPWLSSCIRVLDADGNELASISMP